MYCEPSRVLSEVSFVHSNQLFNCTNFCFNSVTEVFTLSWVCCIFFFNVDRLQLLIILPEFIIDNIIIFLWLSRNYEHVLRKAFQWTTTWIKLHNPRFRNQEYFIHGDCYDYHSLSLSALVSTSSIIELCVSSFVWLIYSGE